MITVSANQIRCTSPDSRGVVAMSIEPVAAMYTGSDAKAAADVLRAYPVGASVHVRHDRGQRSCMNKPDLWQWVEGLT
jgi:hypothetical protein